MISLNAAGTRGCAILKCGNVIHDVRDCVWLDCCSVLLFISQLGIWIKLSKFTLTKIVTVTPYYLVMNETKVCASYIEIRCLVIFISLQHVIKCVLGEGSTVEVQPKNVRISCFICLSYLNEVFQSSSLTLLSCRSELCGQKLVIHTCMHITIHDERSKNFNYRDSANLLLKMG